MTCNLDYKSQITLKGQLMENNTSKNMYLAIVLSIAVIFIFDSFFKKDQPVESASEVVAEAPVIQENPVQKEERIVLSTYEASSNDKRIEILNDSIHGSIRVKGARIDNLFLSKYNTELGSSDNVELLSPAKTQTPYYAEFGWITTDKSVLVPNRNTVWQTDSFELTLSSPIILTWDNNQGFTFTRVISIDENYMFHIEEMVENKTNQEITLYPYGLINQVANTQSSMASVVHEGVIAVVDSSLKEEKYKDIEEDGKIEYETKGGWAGFTDRYWFTSLILNNDEQSKVRFSNTADDTFQVDYLGQAMALKGKSQITYSTRFFAGAKEIKLIDKYEKELGIPKFDLTVDFGWYYFLTKPFFYILDFLYRLIGNMGWAILVFAAILRLLMFPIASKSFASMAKMRKVQPKLKELQERYKNDKPRLSQETMALYKKEKVNPASGCLPLFIQIPIFFSLYKVLNIAIEIRHAPFIGWIKDLSAPDPLTLSVMLHFPVPSLIDIGVWPIIMGLTMYIQQKLNPAPVSKEQARMFMLMPIIFTFMMGHFASGLVIYWTFSNIWSIIQQKAIMHKHGVK